MGRKRILVVDDEPAVLKFVLSALEEDFDTVGATSGDEAALRLRDGAFDLLLTDVCMPGINGVELARRARGLHPGLPVLFMSGYSRDYDIDLARDDFIAKPFRSRQLVGRIDEILGRRSTPEAERRAWP
jgi:DNA-binding response OmpR family regulator